MVSGRAAALLLMTGLAGAATTLACSAQDPDAISSDDEIRDRPVKEATTVLSSTVLLSSGCTAAKVGRRHLLVAARCVVGQDDIAPGKTLTFEIAKGKTARRRHEEPRERADAGPIDDAGEKATTESAPSEGSTTDAGLDAASAPSVAVSPGLVIARVEVNASYAAKCAGTSGSAPEKCAFGSLAASEAKDIAVIVLASDLDSSIPTIPVDLDAVREGDTLVAVSGGCRTPDAEPRRERLTRTLAVPAKASTHRGSAYEKSPALISRLDQSYVVTPGRGWRSGDPGICRTDIGAPLFRSGGTLAVAGITAGYTFAQADDPLPVTVHHTRVDTASEVGPWLESLGVMTVHSCSGSGCVKTSVSGDVPTVAQMEAARKAPDTDIVDEDSDAGLVAGDAGDAGPAEMNGHEVDLGEGTDDGYSSSDPTYADAGKPRKTQTTLACASTTGPVRGGSAFGLAALGLALVSLARRRGGPRRGPASPRSPR